MVIQNTPTKIDKIASLRIGQRGENLATDIKMDVSDWITVHPDANYYCLFKRPDEVQVQPVLSSLEEDVLTWTVRAWECAVIGVGYLEVRAVNPDTGLVAKSRVIPCAIEDSVIDDEGPVPPEMSWVGEVLAAKDTAVAAKTAAEEARDTAQTTVNGAIAGIQAEGQTQVGVVQAEGTTQVGAVQSEGTTQVGAVQAKGTEVLNSIPADYTELSDDVTDLKSALYHIIQYEKEYTTSGTGTAVAEDIPFNFIEGGYYKVDVSLTNPLANVKLQVRDKINDPTVNDTVYNNGYVGMITFQAEHNGKYLRYTSSSNATIKIIAVSISYNYEKEKDDIDELTSHILFDEAVELTDNSIIPNNTSTIDPTPVRNTNAKCCSIPCNMGDLFVITGTGMSSNSRLYAFTNTQYGLITNSNTTASNLQIQAPANGYLICNFYKGAPYELIKKKSKYIDIKFGELEDKVNQIDVDIQPPFSGIDMFGKIACLGDSFTVGGVRNSTDTGWLSARNSYPAVLHNRHTIPVTNFGASGTTTKTYNDNNLATVLAAEAHDVYLMCWGLNDAWGSMTIGSASDIHSDYTQNPDTFYGNYGRIISRLRDAFPMARFVIITPWRNVSPFSDYQEPCIGIARATGLPYIDIRTDPFFNSSLWESTLVSSHPTQVTYTGMAYAVERLMEKCIVENELYFRYAGIENEVPINYD